MKTTFAAFSIHLLLSISIAYLRCFSHTKRKAFMLPVLLNNFVLSLTGVIIVIAALSDAARFRIPNWTCLLILLLFPAYVYVAPISIPWEKHLFTFGIILVVGYWLFIKNWAGAGDIKLIAALALWAGPLYWMPFLFITAVAGGILSLGIGAVTLIKHRLSKSEAPVSLSKTPIPYGVAIAVGGLCTLALLSHPDLLPTQI